MTSEYEYTNVSDLEDFSSQDFSDLHAKYTDSIIESWITQAERIVNTIKGQSYTGTIPGDVVSATLMLADHIAHNRLIDDQILLNEKKIKLIDEDILILLNSKAQNFYAAGS